MIRRFQNPHAHREQEERTTRAQLLRKDLDDADSISQGAGWNVEEAVASLHRLVEIDASPPRKKQSLHKIDLSVKAEPPAIRSSEYCVFIHFSSLLMPCQRSVLYPTPQRRRLCQPLQSLFLYTSQYFASETPSHISHAHLLAYFVGRKSVNTKTPSPRPNAARVMLERPPLVSMRYPIASRNGIM